MDAKTRIEQELSQTAARLRHLGDAVAVEEVPDGIGGSLMDLLDEAAALARRELLFAERGRLVERATRLAEALDRVRTGRYGVCEDCDEPIAPARLRAIPEARTCVRCQDRRERRARPREEARALFASAEDEL
jgi:DnaK suppressor protein